jgi:hypothetical protein
MINDTELTAAELINAELTEGYGPYSVENCKSRYGAAFEVLVRVLDEHKDK